MNLNEQLVFMNIARNNKLLISVRVIKIEPHSYENFNKFNDVSYDNI
jgi:hypothetical protein